MWSVDRSEMRHEYDMTELRLRVTSDDGDEHEIAEDGLENWAA
jgi:hypothetical protein